MISLRTVHAVLACLSWVVIMPCGAVTMRYLTGPSTWAVHGAIQSIGTAMYLVAVVIGIWLARKHHCLDHYHVVIGLLIFALAFIQSFAGMMQHVLFRKYRCRTFFGYFHLWMGFFLITLSMIDGGLGLLWADNASKGQRIAYGVVTAAIWVGWVMYVVLKPKSPTASQQFPRKTMVPPNFPTKNEIIVTEQEC